MNFLSTFKTPHIARGLNEYKESLEFIRKVDFEITLGFISGVFFAAEIRAVVDYCFSRCENAGYRYVQDALLAQAEPIKTTINHGAMVYVCGAKSALGKHMPAALRRGLGESDYQRFIARDGLRLDVY